MAVRLRLARVGKKNAPMFRIVATDSRKMGKGMGLENLGTYNPMTGEYVQFHVERIESWLQKGALPTDTVKKLYKQFKKRAKNTPISEIITAPVEKTEVEAIVAQDATTQEVALQKPAEQDTTKSAK